MSDALLVLGVGNPLLGDDGAGAWVIEQLAQRALPPGVRVEDAGTPGLGLPLWLDGQATVILVDAAHLGETPGAWRRFAPDDVRLMASGGALSLHEPGLADGLALAQALQQWPEHLVLYGVQPQACELGQGLSPAVQSRLPEVVEAIWAEIQQLPSQRQGA